MSIFRVSLSMKRRRLFGPCGADAIGDERGASMTSPSVPEAPWEAVPHLGKVNVNVLAGCTDALVVHQVMQTYQALPTEGKGWYLVFHDACTGAVEAVDVVAPMPLDEVFKAQKLWRVADGELFVDNIRTKIDASVWGQWARYERADAEIIICEIKRPWKHTCFTTEWFRHCARGDFAVLAESMTHTREEDIHSPRSFSVGCLAEAKHCVVLTRRSTARCSEVHRVVALTHYDGSAVLACHIALVYVVVHVGDKRFYVAFDVSAKRAATVALSDWENPYCYKMLRRSCAMQKHHFPVAHKFSPVGVKLFPDHDRKKPLAVRAARSGFGSVQLRGVRDLAEIHGAQLAQSQSLFEVLQAVAMHVLRFVRDRALTPRGNAVAVGSESGRLL